MSYLGLDLGTSSVKLVLIDEKQNLIGEASCVLSISRPKPLHSEQNPEDWWQAVLSSVSHLRKAYPKQWAQLKSIGLTGQQHGAVCLNNNNQVVYPAILWNDGRSYEEATYLNTTYPQFQQITGNTVLPGFTAPKLLWLKNHHPQIFKQITKVLLPKDYIRFRLSGEFATDLSDASGTSWVDVKNRCWSEELIKFTGLNSSCMPKLYEGTEITGKLSPKLKHDFCVDNDVIIIGGGGDNAAGAVSVGVMGDGQAMLSLGTSGVYFIANSKYHSTSNGVCHSFTHCLPGMWHHMGVILTAASALGWWAKVCVRSEVDLLKSAEFSGFAHENTPIFLPYLSGERTPHNNPFAQGVFFGINHDTDESDLTNAVLEGVAFAIRDCQVILPGADQVRSLSLIGGGAKSLYWGKIIANVLNKTVKFHDESKIGPSFGAALLALAAVKKVAITDLVKIPAVTQVFEPEKDKVLFYQDKFKKFQKLYTQVKDLY